MLRFLIKALAASTSAPGSQPPWAFASLQQGPGALRDGGRGRADSDADGVKPRKAQPEPLFRPDARPVSVAFIKKSPPLQGWQLIPTIPTSPRCGGRKPGRTPVVYIRSDSRITHYRFASGLRRSCWTPELTGETLNSESPMLTQSLGFTGRSLGFEGLHTVWRPSSLRVPCLRPETWTRNGPQGILSVSTPDFRVPRNRFHARLRRPPLS